MTEGPDFDPPKNVFNPPPNWLVEPGFVPFKGWNPDPSWGPAPEGWAFWRHQEPSIGVAAEPPSETSRDTTSSAATVTHSPTASPKPKRRWPTLVAAIVATALVIVATVALIQQQQRGAEALATAENGYDSAVTTLNTSISAAEEALAESMGAVLNESSRDALKAEIAEANKAVTNDVDPDDADALSAQTNHLNDARSELEDATLEVEEDVAARAALVATRGEMTTEIANAREDIPAAEQLLAGSDGKVNTARLRDELAAAIQTLRSHVEKDPNGLNTTELGTLKEDLAQAKRDMESAVAKVNADQAAWQKAADEAAAAAALLDPAAYDSISSRDWQLVERDPAAHTGDKYVIFGKVTQFDSNTGRDIFRANTDGQQQSRSYNYDINTMVMGTEEALANVVQGDLVKLYVSVLMPYSYTTTMGAELTVPMVKANMVEVYGSD